MRDHRPERAGDEDAATRHTVAALWLAVTVGAVLAAAGALFAGPLVRLLADDPAVESADKPATGRGRGRKKAD